MNQVLDMFISAVVDLQPFLDHSGFHAWVQIQVLDLKVWFCLVKTSKPYSSAGLRSREEVVFGMIHGNSGPVQGEICTQNDVNNMKADQQGRGKGEQSGLCEL